MKIGELRPSRFADLTNRSVSLVRIVVFASPDCQSGDSARRLQDALNPTRFKAETGGKRQKTQKTPDGLEWHPELLAGRDWRESDIRRSP
jgi:hypothetical protein